MPMSSDLRIALDEMKALRSGERDDEITAEVLDEMGLSDLTPEVIESLAGSLDDEATRQAWYEWGPKFGAISDAPFWLIGVEHPADTDCVAPAPPPGHRMFTTVQAAMQKTGWSRPMALMPPVYPRCSTCWCEMMEVPDEVFVLWPDGEVYNPHGRKLVQD